METRDTVHGIRDKTYEPLLDGRFVIFFIVYVAVIAAAALIIFCRKAVSGETGILSLGACYGTISCARIAFALFGRLSFRASGNILSESVLLVLAGLPAGFVAGEVAGVAFSGILAVELLILGAFLFSGYVSSLQEQVGVRVDLIYAGLAVTCSFGMPLLWLQGTLYARADWGWLLGFSPFHHALTAGAPDYSAAVTVFMAFLFVAASAGLAFLARSRSKKNAEMNIVGEGTA